MPEEGQQDQKPWYDGIDAETIGHWDNKGWKKDDAKSIAVEATKQARELQKHFGVPAEQLMKLPKDATDEAGWKGVYQRLGVPADAKDYDLGIKLSDGSALEDGFVEAMRKGLHASNVAKDKAPAITKAVVDYLETAEKTELAEVAARKHDQLAALKKNWGPNEKINEGLALQGANRLGLTQEEYNKISDAIGWDRAPEIFRRIGEGTAEDKFHEGGRGTDPNTTDGAKARLAELQADPEWSRKLVDPKAGAKEKAEFQRLMRIAHGEAA